MPPFETQNWPIIIAKWYGPKRSNPVRLVVIHTMEYPERSAAAEDIAHDFASRSSSDKASAHICVDSDSIIQCVPDGYVAYAAPGVNHDGIQIELAGYSGQTTEQWRDHYSNALLAIAADAAAQYCLKYTIPAVHLTNEQLSAGAKGIIGHIQATQVYKKSEHLDPGTNFPWSRFIAYVQAALAERHG